MKKSTLNFIRESYKTNGLVNTIHGVFYLLNPDAYIANLAARTRFSHSIYTLRQKIYSLFKIDPTPSKRHFFSDTYHAKVLTSESSHNIIQVNREINIELNEDVLPYPKARKIVLEEACKIGVLNCPCRASSNNPCYPVDVCILVGNFVVDFALEHYPTKFREITRSEALSILDESKKRGNVAHAFFKDAVLDRFYAICNCCTCCCAALQAHNLGLPMLSSSGYLANIDENLCKACGKCLTICPFKAIYQENKVSKVKLDLCLGCMICADSCTFGAIKYINHPKIAKLDLNSY